MAVKFVIKSANDGELYFHLISDDGRKLLASAMYASKSKVFDAISAVKSYAKDAGRFDKLSKDGKAYFSLSGFNQEVLGVSEMYDDTDLRDQALSKVIHAAPDAPIVEASPAKKTKAEVTKTFEARKLNKRTMRAMPGPAVVIRFGAILQQIKEEEPRLLFEHLGEAFEAELSRAKGALRMID